MLHEANVRYPKLFCRTVNRGEQTAGFEGNIPTSYQHYAGMGNQIFTTTNIHFEAHTDSTGRSSIITAILTETSVGISPLQIRFLVPEQRMDSLVIRRTNHEPGVQRQSITQCVTFNASQNKLLSPTRLPCVTHRLEYPWFLAHGRNSGAFSYFCTKASRSILPTSNPGAIGPLYAS